MITTNHLIFAFGLETSTLAVRVVIVVVHIPTSRADSLDELDTEAPEESFRVVMMMCG